MNDSSPLRPADIAAGQLTAEQLANEYTIANLVEAFLWIDALIDDLKKQAAKHTEDLEKLRGAITMKMDANQLVNVRTPYGTPYFSTFESMRVSERAVFFDWVFDHRASDVLTSAVSKEAVRERAEQGENIPGLHIERFRKLRVIRK